MSPDTYLRLVEYIVYWVAFWQTLFVVAYSRAPWYRSAIGRALMLKGFALAATFDLICVTKILGPDYPGHFYVGLLVFSLIGAGSCYQCLVVVNTQRRARRADGSEGDTLAPRDGQNDPHGKRWRVK